MEVLEGVRASHRIATESRQATAEITEEPIDDTSEPLPAYRIVETHLEDMCRVVRNAEEVVDSAGMGWSWTKLRPEIRTGAGPRSFYRDLVDAMLQAYPAYNGTSGADHVVRNTSEVRRWIGRQLAPHFDPEDVDHASTGHLKQAIANILKG
jgi:hypothetical protein